MTGKVIDYTPGWAERAGRGLLQRSRYRGWQKQAVPHHSPEARFSQPLLNVSCLKGLRHVNRKINLSSLDAIQGLWRHISTYIRSHGWLFLNLPWYLAPFDLVSLFMARVFRQMLTSAQYRTTSVWLERSRPSQIHHVCIIQLFNTSLVNMVQIHVCIRGYACRFSKKDKPEEREISYLYILTAWRTVPGVSTEGHSSWMYARTLGAHESSELDPDVWKRDSSIKSAEY